MSTPEGEKETNRIEAFSDGVFAVAITLLVVNLSVPVVQKEGTFTATALAAALAKQWPAYLAFVTSFATVLIMWVNHHRIFKLIHKADTRLMFANGFLLLLVTVVPFPTALLAAYMTQPAAATACAVYAGFFVFINLAYVLLWWSAADHRRLLRPEVTDAQAQTMMRRNMVGMPAYLLAMLIAFWNPAVSVGICTTLWIFWAISSPIEQLPPQTTAARAS